MDFWVDLFKAIGLQAGLMGLPDIIVLRAEIPEKQRGRKTMGVVQKVPLRHLHDLRGLRLSGLYSFLFFLTSFSSLFFFLYLFSSGLELNEYVFLSEDFFCAITKGTRRNAKAPGKISAQTSQWQRAGMQ